MIACGIMRRSSVIRTATGSKPSRFRRTKPTHCKLESSGDFGCKVGGILGDLGRGRSQTRQNILDPVGPENFNRQIWSNELCLAHMRKQREQRLPKAIDVGEQHRFRMTSELLPGELFDEFLKRADAAG